MKKGCNIQQHLILRLTAEFPVLLRCQGKRADVARLLENFLEAGLAVDFLWLRAKASSIAAAFFAAEPASLTATSPLEGIM